MFHDRMDAARQLAKKFTAYKGKHPLILGIPRGAVPMAILIAEELEGEFDILLARKLRAPHHPESAIGAIDQHGWTYIASYAKSLGIDQKYIDSEKFIQLEIIKKRRAAYEKIHAPVDPADRIVIVVDDGLATGATMIAALHGLRELKPLKLVCAVPVASSESLMKVQEVADQVVCLEAPAYFKSVSQAYERFDVVDDEEVLSLLVHLKKR